MLRSEEAYLGPDRGGRGQWGGGVVVVGGWWRAFQTLVKHDMTDRQLRNPLKETLSPLVKTVPGDACRPQRLETQIQVGNAIAISY